MPGSIAKVMMLSLALTLAVPESYAKRVGSGRSVGRQTPPAAMRQRSVPPQRAPAPPQAAPAPVQRTQPDVARPSVPAAPVPPHRTLPSQASTPWGGMLGGALIGLGLGSLIGAQNREPAPQLPVQSEGGSGEEAAASGSTTDSTQAGTAAQIAPAGSQQNRFGPMLLIGLLALVIYFVVRRSRRQRRY